MQTIKQKIKSFIPQITKHLVYSTIAVLVGITSVYAIGSLTPTGTLGDDTQYSLNDIFDKLTDFTDSATEGSGAMVVPGTVSATFRTLSEIYGLLEAEEADLVPENIVDGVEIFGVVGTSIEGTPEIEWSTASISGFYQWAYAISYCNNLEENTHTDWRLPTYIELVNAHLAGETGFTTGNHWSSTESTANPTSFAYIVNMGLGNSGNISKTTVSNFSARCVR